MNSVLSATEASSRLSTIEAFMPLDFTRAFTRLTTFLLFIRGISGFSCSSPTKPRLDRPRRTLLQCCSSVLVSSLGSLEV
ncbi:hypothetical protein [Pseudomonas putida]|uniref:hypothetical protein n=1 Tax=Pseudomonas putida TaxID=303 RepID=UPI00130D8298